MAQVVGAEDARAGLGRRLVEAAHLFYIDVLEERVFVAAAGRRLSAIVCPGDPARRGALRTAGFPWGRSRSPRDVHGAGGPLAWVKEEESGGGRVKRRDGGGGCAASARNAGALAADFAAAPKKRGKNRPPPPAASHMEARLTEAVHASLDSFLYPNAAFLAEVHPAFEPIVTLGCPHRRARRSASTRRVPMTTRSTSSPRATCTWASPTAPSPF